MKENQEASAPDTGEQPPDKGVETSANGSAGKPAEVNSKPAARAKIYEKVIEETTDDGSGQGRKVTKTYRVTVENPELGKDVGPEHNFFGPKNYLRVSDSRFGWAIGLAVVALALALIALVALTAVNQESCRRDIDQKASIDKSIADIQAEAKKLSGKQEAADRKIRKLAGPQGPVAKVSQDLQKLEKKVDAAAETARQNRAEDQNRVLWTMIRDIRQYAPESDIATMSDEDLGKKLTNHQIDIEPQIEAAHKALGIPKSATAEQLEQVRTEVGQVKNQADNAASVANTAAAKADVANAGVSIVANGKKTCFKGLPTITTEKLKKLIADNPCLQPEKTAK